MSEASAKILSVEDLQKIRERARERGQTVVQCHGCFDIVHPGHIRYLQFAKELGDVLVVSVSADDVVGKGPQRPYINEELRLENLAVLEFVDYVCLDHNSWAGPILETLKPDIYVKGKEYESSGDPRFAKERDLVEGYGGKVVFGSGDVIFSSTHILSQLRDQFPLDHEKVRFFCRRHGIDLAGLEGLVRKLCGLRVLVLGDPILDQYVHCEAPAVASETPILSVTPVRDQWFVGAAGLIAVQAAALGAGAAVLTSIGHDTNLGRFADELARHDVELIDVRDDDRPLFVKTRYLVEHQKLLKVDHGHLAPLSTAATRELIKRLEQRLPEFDGLVVTDFGYGLFNDTLVEAVVRVARETKRPYYLDVSHTRRANILRFAGPRLATPTEQELRFALADNESGLSNIASRYYRETDAEGLVLTLGRRGLLLFRRPDEPGTRLPTDYLPAFAPAALDTVGAGDVFLAAMALVDLAGASFEHGAYLGSCLAALHVSHLGNEAVSGLDLHQYLTRREELTG